MLLLPDELPDALPLLLRGIHTSGVVRTSMKQDNASVRRSKEILTQAWHSKNCHLSDYITISSDRVWQLHINIAYLQSPVHGFEGDSNGTSSLEFLPLERSGYGSPTSGWAHKPLCSETTWCNSRKVHIWRPFIRVASLNNLTHKGIVSAKELRANSERSSARKALYSGHTTLSDRGAADVKSPTKSVAEIVSQCSSTTVYVWHTWLAPIWALRLICWTAPSQQ